MSATPVCDCGTIKQATPKGLLMCGHCDTGVCGGTCKLDREYNVNVSKRLGKG